MSKTTSALLGILLLALIALGIVYAARHATPAAIIDTPIVEAPNTTGPNTSPTPPPSAPTTTKNPIIGGWVWQKTIFITGTTNPTTGSGAAVVPAAGKFVATFGTDLNFSSTTDCNSLKGKYIVDNEVLSLGPVAATKMGCAAGSLESEYTKELTRVLSYTINGNELHLNLARDTGTMIFTRYVKIVDPAPVVQLNGSTFRLISYNGAATAADSKYTLAFNNGNLSAKFCNGLGGSYTLSNGTIKASQMIGTLMYCSDSNLMNMESTFSSVLSAGAKLEQQGSTLTLTGSKGEKFTYTVFMN
ncbi:MAG: hypothetical protein JWL92_656 [Candidatus Nomurabacteria bacterium]|nr:hypothetical protein [Candidatus Nomurabacteria bacterium]